MSRNIAGRLAALEKERAQLQPEKRYRIFQQSLDNEDVFYEGTDAVFSYPDGVTLPPGSLPELVFSRAEIDALAASGQPCIVIEYTEDWPPGSMK